MSPKLHINKKSSADAKGENRISLHYYFAWYEKLFNEKLTLAASEFLASYIEFKLVGISEKPNPIWSDNEYFVTQTGLSKEHTVTVKVSNIAAGLIFRTALGRKPKEKNTLKFKDITELEASVLTGFNEFLFKKIEKIFLTPKEVRSTEHTLSSNERQIYLIFYVFGENDIEAGKIIFIFPEFTIKNPVPASPPELPLNINYFNPCVVETDIVAGHSKITLEDVKNLEADDIVILEKSNLYSMMLKNHDNLRINVNPNSSLVIDLDEEENGEETVNKVTGNIWDSLEVDLSAEFENVKIKLGELRQIIEGLVIDVAPIADNKIYLNVEGKQIAAGELVIVGDKYGVKIVEVFDEAKPVKEVPVKVAAPQPVGVQSASDNHSMQESASEEDEIDESDFDFGDYEIEDDV